MFCMYLDSVYKLRSNGRLPFNAFEFQQKYSLVSWLSISCLVLFCPQCLGGVSTLCIFLSNLCQVFRSLGFSTPLVFDNVLLSHSIFRSLSLGGVFASRWSLFVLRWTQGGLSGSLDCLWVFALGLLMVFSLSLTCVSVVFVPWSSLRSSLDGSR